MALEGISSSVSNWLRRQHVTVLDEWVHACVEWLNTEYQERLPSTAELQQLVYEQWLDSDLAEVGVHCLPEGITEQQKGFLNGSYILQINSIRDVSTPAYGQLVKLRGQENENAKVTATQQTQDRFEPKSNRMLMLQLTDGHQNIQAMEFAPIASLSVTTSPGTKIQICGNVQYRHGVLILSSQNVKVLGGEVDALVEENNQDAVLAQALGQPSIPLDQQQVSNQPTQQNHALPSQQQQQHNQQPQQQIIDLTANEATNSTFADTRQPQQNARQQMSASRVVQDDPLMDDFDDDDDFDEAMLQGLEEIELQQQQTTSNNQPSAHQPAQQRQNVQRNATQGRVSNTMYNSTIKTDTKVNTNSNITPQQNQPRTFLGQRQNQNTNNSSFLGNRGNSANYSSSNVQRPNVAVAARIEVDSKPNRMGQINQKPTNQASLSARTATTSRPFLGASVSNREHQNSPVSSRPAKQELPSSSRQGFVKYETNRTTSSFVNRTNVKVDHGVATTTSTSSSNRFQSDAKPSTSNRTSGFAPASSVKQEPVVSRSNQIHSGQTEPAEFNRAAQGSNNKGPGMSGPSTGSSLEDEDESVMAKRRRFYSGQNPGGDIDSNLPYSCLSLVMRKQSAKESSVLSVKGFIMTLVSSLTCKGGWNVMAKINDGTASMDVDFGNEVLTRLIGFSVLELMQTKKAAARASSERQAQMKQEMQQGLEKCQAALVDMSCILTLEIRPEYERPRVLTIGDINEGDCLTLIHQL